VLARYVPTGCFLYGNIYIDKNDSVVLFSSLETTVLNFQ